MTTPKLLALCAITAAAGNANAAISINQNDVSNNTAWTQAGFSAGGTEQYDERSITINDGQGTTLTTVQIILDTTGTFDDSLALDLNADGTLDLISSQSDARIGSSIGFDYTPWVDASPFTLNLMITNTGTTVSTQWNGTEILIGSETGTAFSLPNFTIQDWAGATFVDGNGLILNNAFTTNVIRLGSLNEAGLSGHDISFDIDTVVLRDDMGNNFVFDPDGDGVSPAAIPEPSSTCLLLLSCGLLSTRRKRR